jgi:demethylmenaquinone methyltransferase/2-methoxy-6-polyprenyl-1,4-benzoquinol methylase
VSERGGWIGRRREIRRRFEEIARRYDLANTLLSLGLDARWRAGAARVLRRALEEAGGDAGAALWLDLASGTGAMARALARVGARRIVRLDVSAALLSDAHRLTGAPRGWPVVAESHRVPLAGAAVDAAVMAFATRHLPALEPFLEEMARIVKPGGVLVLLDMGLGRGWLWGPVYRFYFRRVLPRLGGLLTGREETYRWMVRTVQEGPTPGDVVAAMDRRAWEPLGVWAPSGGAAYIVAARRRDARPPA